MKKANSKNYHKIFFLPVLSLLFWFVFTTPVKATTDEGNTTESTTTPSFLVTVNYLGENIFSNTVSLTSTLFVDANQNIYTSDSVTALGALAEASRQGQFSLEIQNYGWGYYVSSVAGHIPVGFDGWVYKINQTDQSVGINDYLLQPNDNLSVFYSVWPWKIESNTTTVYLNEPIVFTASEYKNNAWQTAPSTTISLNNEKFITDANGQYTFTANATGTVTAYIFGTDSWPQNSQSIVTNIIEPITTTTTSTDTNTTTTENTNSGGSGVFIPTYQNLDINKATQYLTAQQQNGDFSSVLYTDWAAIAFGAYNRSHDTSIAIRNYLLTDPTPTAGFNNVSDYARRAMALMALDINPYQTPTNYIKNIAASFDGNQLGDATIFNDDIFALITLSKAGYTIGEDIINKTIDFVISKQSNGNWGSVDLTAAAIQSLQPFTVKTGVSESITAALDYLKSAQQTNGSFSNNSFSTSWAIQAGDALNENNTEWMKKAKNYLALNQQVDGSIENDIWATSQAIPAAMDKNWNEILTPYSKPAVESEKQSSEQVVLPVVTTTLIATTTDIIIESVTSTPTTTNIIETVQDATTITNIVRQPVENKKNVSKIITPKVLNTNIIQPAEITTTEKITIQKPVENNNKNVAKKIFKISGGGTILIGLFLGLRLLKNVL